MLDFEQTHSQVSTLRRWRAAWEQSAVTFERHMRGVDVASTDVYHRLKVEQPHLSDEDVESACRKFLQSINATQFAVFAEWFKSYELPDVDAAQQKLSTWPSDVPKPPDELPGEWDRTLPYMASQDAIEQLSAQVYLFILAAARTARDGRE